MRFKIVPKSSDIVRRSFKEAHFANKHLNRKRILENCALKTVENEIEFCFAFFNACQNRQISSDTARFRNSWQEPTPFIIRSNYHVTQRRRPSLHGDDARMLSWANVFRFDTRT
jgi:hypothetical protein